MSPWLVNLLHICRVRPTPQSPISPETPHRYRRCLHIKRRYRHIEWRVFRDVSQCFKCFMMFHNVLRVFHDVIQVVLFHDVSQCFTSISWYFTMFNIVLRCLVSRATIGIGDRAAANRLRDRDNASGMSGIVTTPQGSAITLQKSAMTPRKWSHAKLYPEWRLEKLIWMTPWMTKFLKK